MNGLVPLAGSVLAGGLVIACTKQKQDPCSDLTGLSEEDKTVRTELEYVAQSPYPEKVCDNCAVWIKPEEGKPCGGCEIMEGPVHPKGYCNSWIAIES